MELDGRLLTESASIAAALENAFPETPLLPPAGTAERAAADALLKLERALFGRWMNWITSGCCLTASAAILAIRVLRFCRMPLMSAFLEAFQRASEMLWGKQ